MEFIEHTIGELIVSLKTGKTPKTSNPEYFDGDILWITPADLKGQKYANSSERTLTYVAIEKNEATLYKKNTILISTIGSDLGKVAMVNKPVSANQQITGIIVKEEIILPELFYYWLILNKKILENKANKATIPQLNNKLLKRISLRFPKDLKEQKNFISYLNNIQALIDSRVETISIIEKLKKTYFLELFFENKERINWRDDLSITESEGVKKTSYGLATKANEDSQGYPIVRMNNISFEGNLSLEDLKHVLIEKEEFERNELTNRDILFNRTNSPDLVGKISVWDRGPGYTYAGYLIKIELDEETFNPYYFAAYFNSDFGKEVLRNRARLSGSLANISASTLMKQKILIPPIDLQRKFEDMWRQLETIKQCLNTSLSYIETIFQSTLQKAFTEDVKIDEDLIFEDILRNLSRDELAEKSRLRILINWMNKDNNRFTSFENYSYAYKILMGFLNEGIIEHKRVKNNITLMAKE